MDSVMKGLMGQRPPPGIFGLEPLLDISSCHRLMVRSGTLDCERNGN